MSINNQEIPITVIYNTKSRIIYQTQFGSFSKFGLIVDFFNKKISSDTIKLKKKYLLNNKEVKENDLLINLIQEYAISKRIINATFIIELDEIFNIGDEEIQSYKKILQPKSENFGLYVYIPSTGSLSLEEYPENTSKYFHLEKFNKLSAYCNSYESLYISGGIYKDKELKDLWIIDNQNFSIEKKQMPNPKSSHSMIYINYNDKEIIFFAGGIDLSSFYYDIKNNKFEIWGNMDISYINPSLIQIDNYLYCFTPGLDGQNAIFFEKTKLDSDEHLWEKIYPNFEKEEIKNIILNKNFCVSKCAGKKIILIGDNGETLDEENIFLYDIKLNLLYVNTICSDQFINNIDKNFYKINNSHNIILPEFSTENNNNFFEIGILNKIKYTFRKIKLNPCEYNQTNILNYKNIRDENLNIGKITVDFKTEELNLDHQNIINGGEKNGENLEQFLYNIDTNKINSEKNIPRMKNTEHLSGQKYENELENNDIKIIDNFDNNYDDENKQSIKNSKKDMKNNENNKKEEFNSYDNGGIDNIHQEFNGEIKNSLNDEINNADDNNMNEENELYEEIDNYEEGEEVERDKFELTIEQPLGEDIIQIENYPLYTYDPENFCDYQPK